jgi:hypothetical protein
MGHAARKLDPGAVAPHDVLHMPWRSASGVCAAVIHLAVLGTVMAGCSDGSLEGQVKDYIAQTHHSYEDCGAFMVDPNCTDGPTPDPIACFADRLASCTPARVNVSEVIEEKSFVETVYLVVVAGKSCRVETFVSISNYPISSSESVTEYACKGVLLNPTCAKPIEGDACTFVCPQGTVCHSF